MRIFYLRFQIELKIKTKFFNLHQSQYDAQQYEEKLK